MNKREITEIRRRFTKEGTSISRMACCYVNSEKNKVTSFTEDFLSLPEEEFHKYLEIASKSLSGKPGNNLIELAFPLSAEEEGGAENLLLKVRNSELKDDELLNTLYDRIIESYENPGNYLIVLFYDAYDVPVKTTDNLALDDSEEVYRYIICAICPVDLSKPGLGYNETENTIASLDRDWVVGPVESAFTFPCFTDRSQDIHAVLCYAKKPLEPHTELWENVLECESKYTAAQKKAAFSNILSESIGDPKEDDGAKDTIVEFQDHLNTYIEGEEKTREKDDPIVMEKEELVPLLEDSGIDTPVAEQISDRFDSFFAEEKPEAGELLDTKALKDNGLRLEKKGLEKQVALLTKKLEDAGLEGGSPESIVITLPDDTAQEITTTFTDGRRCLLIPLEGAGETIINGEVQDF